jgi:hypothetical protein
VIECFDIYKIYLKRKSCWHMHRTRQQVEGALALWVARASSFRCQTSPFTVTFKAAHQELFNGGKHDSGGQMV